MFGDILNRLKKIPKDQIIKESVNEVNNFVVDLNVEQMKEGIDASGSPITPQYAALTKRIKAAKGQPTDRVTLKDTGAFQRSIFLRQRQKDFDLNSKDKKTKKLTEKYGADIFGLTIENQEELSEEIKPSLETKVFEFMTK